MYLRIAIALLSASAIAFEILLIRIFSILQWYHFAAMIISLALLGYGVSGVLLALCQDWLAAGPPRRWRTGFVACSALFGLLSLGCVAAAQQIPFNPLAVVWEPRQFLYLGALYMLLAVPFLAAASGIGLALTFQRRDIARLYGADLIGAAAGALGILAALYLLPVTSCLRGVSAIGFLAAGVGLVGDNGVGGRRWQLLWVAVGVAAVAVLPERFLALRPSEFKGLPKALLVPGTEVVEEHSSPLGWISVVDSPTIPFRHAPGLSLGFPGSLPDQIGVFSDAEFMTAIDHLDGELERAGYLDYLPAAVPYAVIDRPSVLILGAGGGSEVTMAVRQGARQIVAVESNPQLAQVLLDQLRGPFAAVPGRSSAQIQIAEGRSYLRRRTDAFDLIQLPLVTSMAAAAAGSQALGASHLYTVEAMLELLGSLRPDGMLVTTLWLRIPPRENLKLFATAVAALRQLGVEAPGKQLAQIRGWGTVTTLVKGSAFDSTQIAAIEEFCRQRSFDLSYVPGLTVDRANRYNRLEEPYLFLGNQAILSDPETFFDSYKFDIRPVTDDRPFFFHSFKWRSLPELLAFDSRAGLPLVEWGYLVLVATVVQALAAGGILILLPLRVVRRHGQGRASGRVVIYFAALGMAFMLLEIALIQRFTLYLGHPLYSIAVVLAAFLVFAGLGSRLTRSMHSGHRQWHNAPRHMTGLIVGLGALYLVSLPRLLGATIFFPILVKIALTLLILAPLGLLLGMPFPLGLARAAERRAIWIPWAWGINGSASVVGAAAAPLIAVHFGFSMVVLAGLLAYAVASLSSSWAILPAHVKPPTEE